MGQSHEGRRMAIVTGASSGIGAATARLLAAAGCDVGITYRGNAEGARDTAEAVRAHGANAAVARLDLEDPPAAASTIEALGEQLGGIDVLVNNAASNPRAEMLNADVDAWNRALAADLVGPWACARAAAQRMIDVGHGGRIINVTSVLAFVPLEGGGLYCAAKAALEMVTKVMALEWAPHAITVNAVAPGHVATPMNYDDERLAAGEIARPVIPLGRAASAEEIASAIVYLASPAASYATGTSLLVDGGLLLPSGPQALLDATGK